MTVRRSLELRRTTFVTAMFGVVVVLGSPAKAAPGNGVGQNEETLVEYQLEIAHERVPVGQRLSAGLTVNGTIPGPTLRFREGQRARITVKNTMDDQETSIHWHGLLLPNVMDGVPYLTTAPIVPLGTHVFEFDLRQSGTYWYHSHTGLQEQVGVYGAIVVEPREGLTALHAELGVDRETVMVLSDWTDDAPSEVMRTLMRGSNWFAIKKNNAQSLLGALQRGKLGDYLDREMRRMPAMDISDVAYDQFLVNGMAEANFHEARPGERVLVRIVNAAASTYFHLTNAAGELRIVAADGLRVEEVSVRRLLIGIAETYDVIVTLPDGPESIELRATAHDGSGHAALVLGPRETSVLRASNPPPPDIYGMDEMLRAGLSSVSVSKGLAAATDDRPFAPYELLRSLEPSSIARDANERGVRTIELRLTGDMERYLWSINGATLAEDPVVRVKSGEVLRLELINDTMMHHPMHLHGHFFRVLTAAGEFSPVKHTVDVPPMGRRTIEFVANEEPGDWFFHCHILFHMDAGMARVISYEDLGLDHEPTLDPAMIDPSYLFLDAMVLSNMSMGHAMWMWGREDLFVRWRGGYEELHDHGNDSHEAKREIDVGWSHYFDPNLSALVGYRFAKVEGAEDRAFAGVRYRLPFLVHATLSADDELDGRLELEKTLQLTSRLSLFGSFEYDTNTYAEVSTGFDWTLGPALDLSTRYDSDHGLGVGVTLRL